MEQLDDRRALERELAEPKGQAGDAIVKAGADRYLDRFETAARRGVSVTTLGRMIRYGQFPQGDWIAPRKRGWRLSVVLGAPPVTPAPLSGSLARRARADREART